MGFLLFPVGKHQTARRRLVWNVLLIVVAVVSNWLAVFASSAELGGRVVRALLVSSLLVSLAFRVSHIASAAGASRNYANITSAAATVFLIASASAAFFGAALASLGLDLMASFLYVVAIRLEQQMDRELKNAEELARVHGTIAFAAVLWVATDLTILVASRGWQLVLLASSTAATAVLVWHAASTPFPDGDDEIGRIISSVYVTSDFSNREERIEVP